VVGGRGDNFFNVGGCRGVVSGGRGGVRRRCRGMVCRGGGGGRVIISTPTAIGIRPRTVDDTDTQVTTGEILEETLGKVELTNIWAGCALIDARSSSRLSIDCNRKLLATACRSIAELIEAHRNKEVAVLVVFARAGIRASISGIPGEFFVVEFRPLVNGTREGVVGDDALRNCVVVARLVGARHDGDGGKEDSEAR